MSSDLGRRGFFGRLLALVVAPKVAQAMPRTGATETAAETQLRMAKALADEKFKWLQQVPVRPEDLYYLQPAAPPFTTLLERGVPKAFPVEFPRDYMQVWGIDDPDAVWGIDDPDAELDEDE